MKSLNIICAIILCFYAAACDSGVDPCEATNGGVEACGDMIDNDCDGLVDEDCGTCTPTNGGVEGCGDAIDNDCDGEIDEGCSTTGCTEGEARGCGGSPAANVCQERCTGGTWGTCLPTGASEEICGNGIDDNCNNSIDEYCTEDECTGTETEECGGSPGTNLCLKTCAAGHWSACSPNPPNPGTETCDGQDNDCDGTIDNGDCTCEADATMWCGGAPEMHSCHQVCNAGTWLPCQPVSGGTVVEACGDGDDNDCDGQIDETEPCTLAGCGEGEARCEGTTRGDCSNAAWQCSPGESTSEACTGESRGICEPGERSRTCNATNCTWGAWAACTGVVGPASSESCNGLDDDCDGTVDESTSGSDSYGSNSSQGSAHNLGTDPDELTIYPVMDSGGTDWFEFHGDEGMSPSETVTVRLSNLPCDFDITLYWDHPVTGVFEELGSSENGGTSDEEFETDSSITDPLWSDESTDYYIEIEDFGSCGGCYTLYIHGLR